MYKEIGSLFVLLIRSQRKWVLWHTLLSKNIFATSSTSNVNHFYIFFTDCCLRMENWAAKISLCHSLLIFETWRWDMRYEGEFRKERLQNFLKYVSIFQMWWSLCKGNKRKPLLYFLPLLIILKFQRCSEERLQLSELLNT